MNSMSSRRNVGAEREEVLIGFGRNEGYYERRGAEIEGPYM